jgi:hypothetical protein
VTRNSTAAENIVSSNKESSSVVDAIQEMVRMVFDDHCHRVTARGERQ